MCPDKSQADFTSINLRSLIGHAEAAQSRATVEATPALLAAAGIDFIAVANARDLVGAAPVAI